MVESCFGNSGAYHLQETFITQHIELCKVIEYLNEIFVREGLPDCISTDNDVHVVPKEMEEFLLLRGIKQTRCSLYHSETNGMAERFNRVLKKAIQISWSQNRDWRSEIIERMKLYSLTPHSTSNRTPFEVFRENRPNTIMYPVWMNCKKVGLLPEEGRRMDIEREIRKRKCNFDFRHATAATKVVVGYIVRVKYPQKGGRSSRFSPPQGHQSVPQCS